MTKQPNIIFYENSVVFECPENCLGEVVLADLYQADGSKTFKKRISTGNDTGKNKGETLVVNLDMDGVENANYFLKIWTSETGVLAKLLIRETIDINVGVATDPDATEGTLGDFSNDFSFDFYVTQTGDFNSDFNEDFFKVVDHG